MQIATVPHILLDIFVWTGQWCSLQIVSYFIVIQVPEGLEASLRLMVPGELAVVNSVSKYAYDKFPR